MQLAASAFKEATSGLNVCHWCLSCGVACVCKLCLFFPAVFVARVVVPVSILWYVSQPVCPPISMRLGLLLGLCLARRYSDPGGRGEMVVKWLEGEVQGPRERRMERTRKAVLKRSSEAETTALKSKAQRVTVTVQLLQTPPRRPRRLTSRDDLHLHLLWVDWVCIPIDTPVGIYMATAERRCYAIV